MSDLLTEVPRYPEMEQLDPGLPVWLLHGDADVQVSVINAPVMAQKLNERGPPHKLVIYPGGDHALLKYRKQVLGELMAWFHQYL